MKVVVAAVSPTPILWRRASGVESPTELPASTLPARGIAPVRANIASKRVVLPLWKGPTSAMHRGPRGLLTSCPIAASSFGARPVIGSAGLMLPLPHRFGKPEKCRCAILRDTISTLARIRSESSQLEHEVHRASHRSVMAERRPANAARNAHDEQSVTAPAEVPGFPTRPRH